MRTHFECFCCPLRTLKKTDCISTIFLSKTFDGKGFNGIEKLSIISLFLHAMLSVGFFLFVCLFLLNCCKVSVKVFECLNGSHKILVCWGIYQSCVQVSGTYSLRGMMNLDFFFFKCTEVHW